MHLPKRQYSVDISMFKLIKQVNLCLKKIFQNKVAKRSILIIQIFEDLTMAENQALAGSEDNSCLRIKH